MKRTKNPDSEKKDFLRNRNAEYSRKSRQKWKESDEEIQDLYESNEKRIEDLEKLVVKLSKEMQLSNSPSSSSKNKTTSKS